MGEAEMPELDAGCRIGPYEVLARLGSGGMGEVYRARDTRLGRLVALKRIRPELAQDSSRVERFVREARAVARLTHPHISTLYDHAIEDGQHFLVIEHLEGETLAARLSRAPSGLPVSEAVSIAIAVGDALAFAHRHAIVHRGVKPSNIMITPVGVKLLDFGLAQLREDDEQPVDAMTMTRASLTSEQGVVGTLPYMAPEQLTGRADTRSDVFAFGAVLYEMLTGQRAFQGATATSVMAAILERDPPPLPATLPSAFRHLERVVRKCWRKRPTLAGRARLIWPTSCDGWPRSPMARLRRPERQQVARVRVGQL